MLEQAKTKLEMSMAAQKKEHRRELSAKDDELEDARASTQKKVSNVTHNSIRMLFLKISFGAVRINPLIIFEVKPILTFKSFSFSFRNNK